jgi:dipeptidyl aminopeptidase/acylaminoacyl peptidase
MAFAPQFRALVQAEYCPVRVLAGRGYAIFCPNPRGSDVYGQAFREAARRDWGQGDLEDVLRGVDHLVAQWIADDKRLGLAGFCYGFYLGLCALTRTPRSKAASLGACFGDLPSVDGQTDLPGTLYVQVSCFMPYWQLAVL